MKLTQFTSTTGEEGNSLVLGASKSLVPVELPSDTDVYTESIEFNSTEGKLSWIMSDGTILEASGFVTLDQIGRGPTGKRGYTGRKGRDGKAGKDGATGKMGCEGPIGITGPTGEDGEDGEDGKTGIQGGWGAPGVRGPTGPTGPDGIRGFQGSMGRQGAGCIVGPTGPTGLEGNGSVFIGEEFPPEDYYLWLSYITPADLTYTAITANLNDINLGLYAKGGGEFQSEGIFNLTSIDGGSGDYEVVWSGDFKTEDNIVDFQISKNKRQLRIVANANLEPEESVVIEGKVIANIYDNNDSEVKGTIEASYKFTARNSTAASDGPLYMVVSDASAKEGDSLNFVVGLNRTSEEPIQFNYTVNYGSASASDLSKAVGTGSIPVGDVSALIKIDAISDSVSESTETFTLEVYSAVASERNPDDWIANGSILDGDDPPVSVSSSTTNTTEQDVDTTASVEYTLGGELPRGSTEELSFKWRTVDGTAVDGTDYRSATGTVTFNASYDKKSISIPIIGNDVKESAKELTIEVYDVGSKLSFNSTSTTIKILDDDGTTTGGGGGCIVYGQKVNTGELVNIELIGESEELLGQAVPSSDDVFSWSSKARYPNVNNTVVALTHSTYSSFVRINNKLELTPDHLILTKRKDVWRWLCAGNVVKGDYLMGEDEAVLVVSTELIHETVKVVDLDVEEFDTYFVSGFLVHNAEIGRRLKN